MFNDNINRIRSSYRAANKRLGVGADLENRSYLIAMATKESLHLQKSVSFYFVLEGLR